MLEFKFTLMHYIAWAGLTEDDVAAMFAFLHVHVSASTRILIGPNENSPPLSRALRHD